MRDGTEKVPNSKQADYDKIIESLNLFTIQVLSTKQGLFKDFKGAL